MGDDSSDKIIIINIMKKIILLFTLLLFTLTANAEVLQAGVSLDDIPKSFFGTWSVKAKLDTTNSRGTFKPQSADLWTITREEDIIRLDNPFSGASAEISVRTVEGNLIVFSKRQPYDGNKVLTDTVTIRIEDNKFTGINSLTLESFSLVDNHLMKTETASYLIKGEKIAGDSVISTDK